MKTQNVVMPVKTGISSSARNWIPAFAGMTILMFASLPALAAPFTFAPENCDFQITFPEKPFIEQRCKEDKKDCEDIATFTQTKDASAISFRVSCRPEKTEELKKIKSDDLKRILQDMAKTAGAAPFADDAASLEGNVLSAVTLAIGKRNERDLLYTGQIWVGSKSLFTLESEITGPDNEAINKTYSGILKDMKLKSAAAKEKADTPPIKKTP